MYFDIIRSFDPATVPELAYHGRTFLSLIKPHLHLAMNDQCDEFFQCCKRAILDTGVSKNLRQMPEYKNADALFEKLEGKRIEVKPDEVTRRIASVTAMLYCRIALVFDAKNQNKRNHWGSALVPLGDCLAKLIISAVDADNPHAIVAYSQDEIHEMESIYAQFGEEGEVKESAELFSKSCIVFLSKIVPALNANPNDDDLVNSCLSAFFENFTDEALCAALYNTPTYIRYDDVFENLCNMKGVKYSASDIPAVVNRLMLLLLSACMNITFAINDDEQDKVQKYARDTVKIGRIIGSLVSLREAA